MQLHIVLADEPQQMLLLLPHVVDVLRPLLMLLLLRWVLDVVELVVDVRKRIARRGWLGRGGRFVEDRLDFENVGRVVDGGAALEGAGDAISGARRAPWTPRPVRSEGGVNEYSHL